MEQSALIPEYYTKFSCIGNKCEDNCCHEGWFIAVERTTYKKYQKVKDKEWKEALSKNVKRNKKATDDASYAYIKLNEEKSCSFLAEDGLCNIHSGLGENYLCGTCKVYPRIRNKVNGQWEQSLSTSCPEAARIVLGEKEGLHFSYNTENYMTPLLNNRLDSKNEIQAHLKNFWEVRAFVIEILQNKKESLENRLKFVGFFLDHISFQNDEGTVLNTIPSFRTLITTKKLHEFITNQNTNEKILINFLSVIKFRYENPLLNQNFNNSLEIAMQSLNLNDNSNMKLTMELHNKGLVKYNEFLNDNDYKLENYLVNVVFNSLIPNNQNPLVDYAIIVNYYSILKTIIVGKLVANEDISDDSLVQLIYSFGRNFENYTPFKNQLITYYESKDKFKLTELLAII